MDEKSMNMANRTFDNMMRPGNQQNTKPANSVYDIQLPDFTNITLLLTENCNLRCPYCYEQYAVSKKRRVMSWETAKKGLDLFFSMVGSNTQYTSISLFGGEPHLAFDTFKKTVEYTLEHRTISGNKGDRFSYSTNTNGTILTPEIYELYSRLGKKMNVRVSIDGYGANHDLTRVTANGTGSWAMLEKNFSSYMKLRDDHGLDLTAVMTINKSNYKSLYYNTTKLYELTGISQIGTLMVQETQWDDEDFDCIIEQVARLFDYGKSHGINFPICRIRNWDNGGVHLCSSGTSSFIVDVDGDIYPCHRCFYYDLGKIFRMGHVDMGIDPSKRKMMLEFNNIKNMPARCRECGPIIRNRCHICYPGNAFANANKDPFEIPLKVCMFQKQIYYMLVEKWRHSSGRSFTGIQPENPAVNI